jgi:hypothetical protein
VQCARSCDPHTGDRKRTTRRAVQAAGPDAVANYLNLQRPPRSTDPSNPPGHSHSEFTPAGEQRSEHNLPDYELRLSNQEVALRRCVRRHLAWRTIRKGQCSQTTPYHKRTTRRTVQAVGPDAVINSTSPLGATATKPTSVPRWSADLHTSTQDASPRRKFRTVTQWNGKCT